MTTIYSPIYDAKIAALNTPAKARKELMARLAKGSLEVESVSYVGGIVGQCAEFRALVGGYTHFYRVHANARIEKIA